MQSVDGQEINVSSARALEVMKILDELLHSFRVFEKREFSHKEAQKAQEEDPRYLTAPT